MVDAKVDTPLEESEYYFINRSGRKFKTEGKASGHQIKHNISHPQYVLFGDEGYTDTNYMDYGNNGGQHYISIKGMKKNLLLSKSLVRFTLMVLTTENGEIVLCICILAAQSLIVTGVKGLDYRVSIPYDSSNTMEGNIGEGKAIPGLPVCKFRG